MKRVLTHTRECKLMLSNKWNMCKICKQFVLLCTSHAKNCNEDECSVPVCDRIKKNLRDQRNQESVQRHHFMQQRTAQMGVISQDSCVQSANDITSTATNTSTSDSTPHSSSLKDSFPTHPAYSSVDNDGTQPLHNAQCKCCLPHAHS